MKKAGIKIILGLMLLSSYFVNGQRTDLDFDLKGSSYINLNLANHYFNNKVYDSAVFYYSRSSLIELFPQQQYKFALALYVNNDTIRSKNIFYHALENGLNFDNENYFNASPLIKELSINKKVYELARQTCFTDSLAIFPAISDSLQAWRVIDQSVRGEKKYDLEFVKHIDSINRVKLKNTIKKIGWPGIKEVGLKGENAAFLIAQHSDNDITFQKLCLSLMEKELRNGNVTMSSYVMLLDRYLINIGKSQIFGTQVYYNEANQRFEPKELKYPEEVEELRDLYTLNKLSDYLEYFNIN